MTKKKPSSMRHSRRGFLKGLTAGATAAATAPWLFLPRRAHATPAFGAADSVIILYAAGGLRSQPLFHADVAHQHNPFGRATSVAPGTQWGVGTVLGTQPLTLFGFGDQPVEMPAVPQIANDIAVLAGVDHEPGSPDAVAVDHFLGDIGVATGDPMATATGAGRGLLSVIQKDHPGYMNGSIVLPPFDIGLSSFGRGEGDFAAFRPIALQSATEFTGRSAGSATAERAEWARTIREKRDERFVAKRAPHVAPYLAAARDAKIHSRAYAAALRDPALDLVGAPQASFGGVTNAQLLEVLGGGPFGGGQWGLETAFALRLVQLGVPAVSVMRYLYDTHSDEKTLMPMDAGDLGRQLAGLHFLLHRMVNPQTGLPLWNRTVVIVVSEFSRDNVDPATGFNSADGSDHNGTPATRNQCWPIMGGPITAGGARIGRLDPDTLQPVESAMSVRSVLSTLLDVLGIDHTRYWSDAPIASLFT